jgi:hypothetical protein
VNCGGNITKEQKDYICKGKIPKKGFIPGIEIFPSAQFNTLTP